ncbi:MAG: dihydrofolate reductase family protein [bacterium]
MGKIVANMNMTLDGVIQAPGRPDEDTRDGFRHGGWATPYFDAVMAQSAGEGMSKQFNLLFGRRTYEDFHSVWPKRTNNPFTDVLNRAQKYVVSNTLTEPLVWSNSTLLSGDAGATVARLKAESDTDLVILGSAKLVQSLMRHNLIDEYNLSIHPLVLGSGRRLFVDETAYATLTLVESKTSSTGVVMTTYRPAQTTA